MLTKIFKGLLWTLVIVIAILLPLFRNQHPIITGIYKFISISNKDYYGVVLSALAIFVTFLIFNSQNMKEKKQRSEDEQIRKKREENEYQEKREKRFSSARPYFVIEKDTIKTQAKIKIFMEDDVPLENILVCERKLSDKEDEVKSKIIGTKNSGDYIYQFSLDEIEMIVVKCKTYFDEEVYFQYYTGDIAIHYRMIENSEDISYSRSLGRLYLSDCLIEQKGKYNPDDVKTEIYKQNIYSFAWERVAMKRFSQYRNQILESIVEDSIFTGNKNLEIIGVIEKDNIGEILGSSITYLREHKEDFSIEIIIELLEVIKNYINNTWYTNSSTFNKERIYYFKGNLTDSSFSNKYSVIFDKSVDIDVMNDYVDDLILYVENGLFNDYLFRNLEVYLNENITMATGRYGYDNEVNLVNNKIRSRIKQILSKTIKYLNK